MEPGRQPLSDPAGRLLVVDHRVATPTHDAGSLRMVNLLRVFSALGYEVTYLPRFQWKPGERRRLRTLARDLGMRMAAERSVTRHLSRHGGSYAAVVLCRFPTAWRYLPACRRLCPRLPIVFDTVDLHFLRELRQSEVTGDQRLRGSAAELRTRELDLVRAADATIVVSTVEAELLGEECRGSLVHVVPTIHEVRTATRPFAERSGLVFLGGFEHAPNVDAALWLVGEIMPLVRRLIPDVALTLLGSRPPKRIRALAEPKVRVTGHVPQLEPWLDESRLSLAPLRFGAGVKGKITHSLGLGLPVVATPLACEGMPLVPGRDVAVAAEPEDFARLVAETYLDEPRWKALSANGMRAAAAAFSFESARRAVAGLMTKLPRSG